MADLGEPSSYLALESGVAVHCSDGEHIGEVHEVVADRDRDIFEGFHLKTSSLSGGRRFVEADHIEEIFGRGVQLKIDRTTAEALPDSNL